MRGGVQLTLLVAASLCHPALCYRCDREPEGTNSPKRPADNRFRLKVIGQPDSYVPQENYTVSLQGERNHHTSQKFTGFVLVVEPGVQTSPWEAPLSLPNVGTFSLLSDSLTRFNKKCPNSVMQAHYIPKSDIQVLWTAPPSGSGCVVFRSTVVEYNDVWYMDDGPLSLTLCEKVQETSQPEIVKTCCACDEAKYEVTFHGLWTRHTHPRHYPNNSFVTRFSDVIGASHTVDYRFWDYGEIASEGLQEVAEKGSTRMLESELKAMSEHIRTIIKARGISYPNITGKTFAVFRVDNKHHLMSLVSKITPSPDWIVGVAGLELCLRNCTWVKNKVLKLYPWDVGTDSGITYEAANSQTIPPEPIRQILTSSPNNPESPFYDPSGADMKPMAQLILTRQRLYEKSCADGEGPSSTDEDSTGAMDNSAPSGDCEVSRWEDRGHCSVTCGKGVRYQQRFYVDQKLAEMNNCQVPLTARKSCYGAQRVCRMDEDTDDVLRDPTCAVTEWAEWSSCSKECGRGVRTRVRKYQQAHARKRCSVKPGAPILEQTDECLGEEGPCEGEEESELPQCEQMTEWSDWGPCSVTCGKGTRMRTRLLKASSEDLRMMVNMEAGDEEEGGEVASDEECDDRTVEEVQCEGDTSSCEFTEDQARKICQMTKDVGPCRLTTPPRWFFDKDSAACHKFSYGGCRGNSNNFLTKEECEQTCQDYREALIANRSALLKQYGVSLSGVLSYNVHHPGQTMDPNCVDPEATTKDPFNGLKPGSQISRDSTLWGLSTVPTFSPEESSPMSRPSESGEFVDCTLSRWTPWSHCSVTCGRGFRTKTRYVKTYPKNGGKDCPKKLLRRKKCKLDPCDPEEQQDIQTPSWEPYYMPPPGVVIDCELSEWTPWSSCSMSCGSHAVRQRTRSIIAHPSQNGLQCGNRLETEPCKLLPCKA